MAVAAWLRADDAAARNRRVNDEKELQFSDFLVFGSIFISFGSIFISFYARMA